MAFAVSTIIGGLGLAVAGYGAYESYEGQKQQANALANAQNNQAQIGALEAQNVGVEQQQLQLQTQQQNLEIQTNRSVVQQQQAADDIRQQAASLDATRRIRQQIRTGIVASGTALNVAANSGAVEPGSSAVKQTQANIQGTTNTNRLGITQNLQLGQRLAQNYKNITNTYLDAQTANQNYVNQSEGLQTQVLNTQKKIYALGGDASSNYAQAALAGGQSAMGSSLYSVGLGLAGSTSTIGQLTNYFGGVFGGSSAANPFNETGSLY